MKSVLFVRLSAMGDVVHGLGAIAALHRVRPDWRLTVLTQREHAPLVRGAEGVSGVVEFDRRGGLRALWRLRAALREGGYDVALDLQGNWKSALLTRISAARERWGAGRQWRQEPLSRVLLQRTFPVDGPDHPTRIANALVRELAPEAPFLIPRLSATPDEVAAERRALAAIGVDPAAPFRVLVVTDPADPRALRPEIVTAETAQSPHPVVHLLGPAEAGLSSDHAVVLRHRAGEVRRLVALGAILADCGGEVIGPDQGGSHVLAAAGARCQVLFGAQDPRRTAPLAATALVHPEPPSCSPCSRRRCNHPRGPVCMQFDVRAGTEVPFVP